MLTYLQSAFLLLFSVYCVFMGINFIIMARTDPCPRQLTIICNSVKDYRAGFARSIIFDSVDSKIIIVGYKSVIWRPMCKAIDSHRYNPALPPRLGDHRLMCFAAQSAACLLLTNQHSCPSDDSVRGWHAVADQRSTPVTMLA